MTYEDRDSTNKEFSGAKVENRVTMIPIFVFMGAGVCLVACVLLLFWADIASAIPIG